MSFARGRISRHIKLFIRIENVIPLKGFLHTLQELWLLATKIYATTQISPLISTHSWWHLIVAAKAPKQNYYCDDTYSHRYMLPQIGRRENFPQAGNGRNPFATRCYFFATRILLRQNNYKIWLYRQFGVFRSF